MLPAGRHELKRLLRAVGCYEILLPRARVLSNFSEYKARFTMPGNEENMFYTLEMGPVQMVIINTEWYYYLEFGTQMAINQYHWLEAVLKVG